MKLICLLLLLLHGFVESTILLPEPEYRALYDLYNSTNGEGWSWSTDPSQDGVPWHFSETANPCTDDWQGVTCVVANTAAQDTYHVSELQLISTRLVGNLPNSVNALVELQLLRLSYNQISGTIPSTMCNMSALRIIALDWNNLSSAIPACIGNISTLHALFLAHNSLAGPIPASIMQLPLLTALDLAENQLTGQIPPAITTMHKLNTLRLDNNALTGRIPTHIGDLSQMIYLHLSQNQLSGPIPVSIGNLSNMWILALDYNKLTGPIPSTIGQLRTLKTVYFVHNQLTGPLPSSIGNLSELVSIMVALNTLSGPIDAHLFANLTHLDLVYINNNHFTGPLPALFANLSSLAYYSAYYNMFSGSIPESFGQLTRLQYLFVYNNRLTGTIPAVLGAVQTMQNLELHHNLLTGTLPTALSNLTALFTLEVNNNHLTGPLTDVLSAAQTGIFSIQLDDNQFTGELPSVFFALPQLTLLSIVGSCLHGTLPDNVCEASSLQALILYGLTTGSSCRARGVQSVSQGRNTFSGQFPNCLLNLPRLATLLLSSNGLTGSIASDAVVSTRLVQLDLSHNRLSGTIPNNIQNHTWLFLALSNNRLDGVLASELNSLRNVTIDLPDFPTITIPATDPMLSLSSNRLSGAVPSSLMPLHNNLSVLAGNLFECKYDKSNLPEHDSDVHTYECASNSFDISIYVWLGFALMAAAFVFWQLRFVSGGNVALPPPIESLNKELLLRLKYVQKLLGEYSLLVTVSLYCAAFCVLVLLPYYAIVSHYEGTHTHQYAYVLSAIYVSGVAPFVVDVLLLAVLLVGLLWYFTRNWTVAVSHSTVSRDPNHSHRTAVWVCFVLINIIVVLGANIAFVYVVLYQSSQLQTLAQVLLSLFKLSWSSAVAPLLIRELDGRFNSRDEVPPQPFFALQLLVALFNNIAIPCLVVAAIDPNCFSNAIMPAPTETVEYLVPACQEASVGATCTRMLYERASLQFTPPFTYSYQCSASFITYYAPTFIYMSMSTVFLSPLLQYVLFRLYQRFASEGTVHLIVSAILPRILQTPPTATPNIVHSRRPIVNAVGILVTLLTQLGILLAFGAIFPPVALAMAVSISAVVFMTRCKVQRYVHAVVEAQQLPVLDMINAECERVGTREQMRTAVVIIICYCCAFYAMFLFDTLGDAVGFDASAWVLFVVPLAPLSVLGGWMLFQGHYVGSAVVESDCTLSILEMSCPSPQVSVSKETVNVLHNDENSDA